MRHFLRKEFEHRRNTDSWFLSLGAEAQNTQEHLTVLHHGSTKISIPVDPRLHVGRDVEILVSEGRYECLIQGMLDAFKTISNL